MAGRHGRFRTDTRMNFEDSWGTAKNTGHVVIPFLSGSLTNLSKEIHKPDFNIGHTERSHVIAHGNVIGGSLVTSPFRTNIYNLLKWGLTRHGANDESWSATVDWKSPNSIRRFTGVIVDNADFSFDFLSGEVQFTYGLRGKLETTAGIAAFADPDYNALGYEEIPFISKHCAVSLYGSGDTTVEQLSFSVPNTVEAGPFDTYGNVTWLCATRRDITGTFRVVYDDDIYTDYLTNETKGAVEITMTHPLGGSNDIAVITLPEVLINAAPPTTDMNGVVRQECEFSAELDSNNNAITWSLS